jgi:hypothetical protein
MKITEKVKSFEDACQLQGLDAAVEIPFAEPKNDRQKALNAFAKLAIITPALNEDWVPNWDNRNEYKYSPWFDMRSESAGGSGLGFSFCDFAFDLSHTYVGSRLVFKSRELARYAGTQFVQIYKDMMTLNPS